MTLTRFLPSLRRSLPEPIKAEFWPERTIATTTDVLVSGISLLRLAEACGTPCVHSAAAVIPRTGGRPSPSQRAAVLVVRITAVGHYATRNLIVQTDARLDNLPLIWSETRLINRASTARSAMILIDRRSPADISSRDDVLAVELPSDLRVGDLLAIPSRSMTTTWAMQPRPLTGTRDSEPENPRVDNQTHEATPSWLEPLE